MFVTNWNSTTKIQKISEITNFFRHYFLSRTEVIYQLYTIVPKRFYPTKTGIDHIQDKVLHKLCLDELWHFPSHFHQLCQCHRLEAIARIYSDVLIPHFLTLGRIGTHTTHAHSRYELREIRYLQMAVIQIVHQEVSISSNLVALIIETTFHHHITLDITSRMQWKPVNFLPLAYKYLLS